MMLYDRLVEKFHNHAKNGNTGKFMLDRLSKASVYNITSILPIIDVDEIEKSQISKRPPHDNTWVEWESDQRFLPLVPLFSKHGEELIPQTCGILVTKMSKESIDSWNKREHPMSKNSKLPDFKFTDECFSVTSYVYLKNNSLKLIPAISIWHGENDMRDVKISLVGLSRGEVSESGEDDEFIEKTVGLGTIAKENFDQVPFDPTAAFMSFALLHCKNIVTEIIQGKEQSNKEKRWGLPKRTDCKVLKLVLPSTINRHNGGSTTEGERQQRLHLCRGHFKNLQHERFKNKGWHWWPAHFRGDPNLGTIEKRYELITDK